MKRKPHALGTVITAYCSLCHRKFAFRAKRKSAATATMRRAGWRFTAGAGSVYVTCPACVSLLIKQEGASNG